MKRILCLVLTAAVLSAAVFAGGQQGSEGGDKFPAKPVTCIIPYAPGGGSDVLTRGVMKYIKLPNGQPLVGRNIEGAGGYTGAIQAYNSAPDGYTILTHNPMDLLAYDLSGQDALPLWSQAECIAIVVADYNLVTTNKTAASQNGWKTIEDVVAWVKAHPGQKLKWGMVGAQTVNMVDSQRVARALGIFDSITFVPYDGGANTRTAALANEIQLETCTAAEIPGVVASGDNIPLLVINDTRIKSFPAVPSTVEKGIKIATAKWRGYFAPKGTPAPVMQVLSAAFKQVTDDPEFVSNTENNLKFDVRYVEGQAAKAQMQKWHDELKPFFDEFKTKK
ncbi:MAG: tripartite tricarboxylate transporter substrate binding protein [Treponema sp.]|jgi:tripartite-type tricarboxylate transporter receptor subunit TctC|nr:tripartite tricarboxylate transporter substrate binding protein [Treponema sp.]